VHLDRGHGIPIRNVSLKTSTMIECLLLYRRHPLYDTGNEVYQCVFSKFYHDLVGILEFVLRFEVCYEDGNTGRTNDASIESACAEGPTNIISSNVDIYKGSHEIIKRACAGDFVLDIREDSIQISCIFSQANLAGMSQGLGDDPTYCMNVETNDRRQILRSTPSGRSSLLSFFVRFIGRTALAGRFLHDSLIIY